MPWRRNRLSIPGCMGFPGGSNGKESTCNSGDLGSIPGLGRSPGEGHSNSAQYFCLENPMDRGAWWATVQGLQRVGHNWSNLTHTHSYLFNLLLQNEKMEEKHWILHKLELYVFSWYHDELHPTDALIFLLPIAGHSAALTWTFIAPLTCCSKYF